MILHITQRQHWLAARETDFYHADSLASEGYIHCSRPEQLVKTANSYYRGQQNLVLLKIDPALVAADIRYEALVSDEPFPHIYGPLNMNAVVQVLDFAPGTDGKFQFPAGLLDSQEETR